ncbi:RNA polymerase recycling motor HelD [Levilactobacillus bambusae]|uniref:ATP-dependent DNA helicase n=1 Tax=Levilactobacillus bambusae TaxID=2024736 RepID=A0A2V1N139_9LACO|nr:RNA polymerase recycling motor HelD [Levilactobacillus bambusae]PWG00030.1 ATP-dependent DNA helicase [Levilactobacillus bambusae]
MADNVKKQEQDHLNEVIGKLKVAQTAAERTIKTAKDDTAAIRTNLENDVRINTSSYSGMMDTALSLRQQQQMLDERQNSQSHAETQLATLHRLEKQPYFARIDFHEAGEKKDETIYIGLSSFSDSPDHFLIYDWRAPISSIYYEGKTGEVTYTAPAGEQHVDVKLKRQFQIEAGQIKTIFDTEQVVGDQMLLEALGGRSDTKMKSIVTTIQSEQNKIIRDTKSDLLFVQGAAGSGKTAAVLQRIAYLLYRYRGKLTSSQVILFSPNQLFNDYIDQVLPELGEHNMVQLTYYQYAGHRLPKMQVETLAERFEENETPAEKTVNKLKNSLAFFNGVTAYAEHLGQRDMIFRDIKLKDRVFFEKEKIAEIYYSFNQNYNLSNRLEATRNELIKQLNRRVGSETRAKWVEETIQGLSKEEINQLYGTHPHNFEAADEEYKFLARKLVHQAFKPIQRAITRNRFLSINRQYVHMLRDMPKWVNLEQAGISLEDWKLATEKTIKAIQGFHMTLTDVSAYLYLYDKMTGKRGNWDIKYVFIDEIQDYTAFQLAFLKFSFPHARFTLLGDLNQAIFTKENSHTLLSELSTMFDEDKTRVVQLTRSYRSTQQITDFTKHILRNGEEVTAFDRTGSKPTVAVAADEDAAVNRLIEQIDSDTKAHETTAIIGKTLEDCRQLADQLKARGVKATLIQTENQRLATGVIIVPSFLAKGLEFDAVVAWNTSAERYKRDDERQLLYTICSRAMHQLTLIAIGDVTPLLDLVPEEEYEVETITAD